MTAPRDYSVYLTDIMGSIASIEQSNGLARLKEESR